MGLEWSDFWNSFLDNYKLNGKVREINSFSKSPIEDICHLCVKGDESDE